MANILVIDDSSSNREFISSVLEYEGHKILQASNGLDGIEMAEIHDPDVIILDIMMPDMDGYETCRIIRSHPLAALTYIIFLSAKGKVNDRVTGLDTGADAYLSKPFEPEELKAVVRTGVRTTRECRNAMKDGLTGLWNRRAFDSMLSHEFESAIRYDYPVSLAIMDIDHFKAVNDNFGHDEGDLVLAIIAAMLHKIARPSDLTFRWGGEEFVWLLPHTSLDNATIAAERLRSMIELHHFEDVGSLTASFGVTDVKKSDTTETLWKRGDEALYLAKHNGRNRIEVAS